MAEALKDNINEAVVRSLAEQIAAVAPDVGTEAFVREVQADLDGLELKERVALVADALAAHLPSHYPDALDIVVAVASGGLDYPWAGWPLCSFVERHGLDHPQHSLDAMATLTQLWSCEFAVRPYLEHHLELTRTFLRSWAVDGNDDVRRLPSEGTRPRLPWGPRVSALIDDPRIGVEILELLYLDQSEMVRRSVANHLNDLSRSHPDLVVDLLAGWMEATPPVDARLVSHALRSLVKQGNGRALGLLGYSTDPELTVGEFTCGPRQVELGDSIELSARLTSTSSRTQLLMIDFVVHHVTASGSTSPKVFKWTKQALEPGATIVVTKRRLIQQASTRRYHPGQHRVDLQIGGHTFATTHFDLTVDVPS